MSEENNITQVQDAIQLPLTVRTLGKWIYQTLSADSGVSALVGSKVSPFLTREPKDLPWIVWDNVEISYARDKDSNDADTASFIITCAAATVDDSYTLADAVVAAVNDKDSCRVDSIHAYWQEEVGMIQEINVTIDLY